MVWGNMTPPPINDTPSTLHYLWILFNVRHNSPVLAVVERLYAAPILCGARRDLALESASDRSTRSVRTGHPENLLFTGMHTTRSKV